MLDAYLSREPSGEDRIETAIAQLCSMFYNANRGQGAKAMDAYDFMPFRNAWANARYSDADLKTMATFGVKR